MSQNISPEYSQDGNATKCIVGAGLVGSLLSSMLTRHKLNVDIYERRPDLRKEKMSAGRSINLAISTRGLHALEKIGLKEKVLSIAIPMYGRAIHNIDGTQSFQPYAKNKENCIYSISRAELNKILLDDAESQGANFFFNQKIKKIDFSKSSLETEQESTRGFAGECTAGMRAGGASDNARCVGDKVGHKSDTIKCFTTLFGTDGSGSIVRESMKALPGFQDEESTLEHSYKEFILPPKKNANGLEGHYLLEKNALHIWPRGTYMFIALPNNDGSFTCTLFLPTNDPHSTMSDLYSNLSHSQHWNAPHWIPHSIHAQVAPLSNALAANSPGFSSLQTPEAVQDFFRTQFPDVFNLIPNLTESFFSNPTGHMSTITCAPWYTEQSTLLGDAAHGMVPFYGQGMNCGFEDCSILDSCLSGTDFNWTNIFKKFFELRKKNTDAISQMALENFIEMRDKVAHPEFLLRKKVEHYLEEVFPGQYYSRYTLVTFSNVPYTIAYAVGCVQDEILKELCQGISNPKEVDLEKAKKLIYKKLLPLLINTCEFPNDTRKGVSHGFKT